MSLRRSPLSSPPKALRQPGVHLDNLAIVPACLLPRRAASQAYANRLPRGQVLIIVPHASPSSRRTLAKVAASLEANGHRVRTLPVERFRAAAPPTPHRR